MATVKSMDGHVLEGWERARTGNGIPYYINHREESTQWDHPEMTRILEELQKYNGVKYAAYRTAEKLKYLINAFKLNLVRWVLIDRALLEHGFRYVCVDEILNCFKVESILFSLCELGQTDTACTGQTAVHAELLLNLLLNMFDADRKQGIPLVYATIALGVLCSGRLLEKYKYITHHFIDKTNFLMKRHIQIILGTLARIPELLGEKLSFGSHLVIPALESCCQQNCGLSEEGFLEWLFREPQTLVWLPTFSRLKASELVIHPIRCSVCKLYPIVGLRYCCLHCLKFDSCQNCFFRGRLSKGHKPTHPMREYCNPTSSWEETKTLLKALKNRLNRQGSSRSKPSYLPIGNSNMSPTENNSSCPYGAGTSNGSSAKTTPSSIRKELVTPELAFPRSPVALTGEHQKELESIIVRLEDENRHLSKEIDKFHVHSENCSSGESRSSQGSSWEKDRDHGQKDFLIARQELLEDHSHQMELQIKRLKQLLQFLAPDDGFPQFPKPPNLPLPPIPRSQGFSDKCLESTPIEGKHYVPPQEWSPFVKLQTELDNLERLTTGLQESSRMSQNNNGTLIGNADTTFVPSRLRRSCRGVSFTDTFQDGEEDASFERRGSVRPKMNPVHSRISNHSTYSVERSTVSNGLYDNCSLASLPRSYLPNGKVTFGESISHLGSVPGQASYQLPQMPTPQKNFSRLDTELQTIIDQLERVLPNSWSSSPSLLPEEKAKVMQAVSEVEEAMAQFLVIKTQTKQQN